MEDRLELSGGVIAALIAAAVVCGLLVLIATGGGGEGEAKASEADRARFDRFAEQLVIDLTFSRTPRPAAPAGALGRLFAEHIGRYAIRVGEVAPGDDLDRAKQHVRSERRAVLSDRVKAVLDRDTVTLLGNVLDRTLDARLSRGSAAAVDALDTAVIELNNRLVARGRRYVLHPHVNHRGGVWLLSYVVDQRLRYRAGEYTVTAIRVRRLDTLNFHANALGFAAPQRQLAWVRAGRIEEHLVARILPQLADDAPAYYDVREHLKKEPWVARANRRARLLFASDYGGRAADPAAMRRLGQLLAQRQRLFARWKDLRRGFSRLARRMSRRLHLPARFASALSGLPFDSLLELMAIENELSEPAMRNAFAAAMDVAMRSVERHEVQHRLDFARSEFPFPPFLERHVQPGDADAPSRFARSTNWELSAMLSELARAPERARSELAAQVGFLLQPNVSTTQYGRAVAAIVDGLAIELGVSGGPIHRNGALWRDRVVHIFTGLTAKPAVQLADGARALWQKFYGERLPVLSRAVQ